jgi:hypothetical protein
MANASITAASNNSETDHMKRIKKQLPKPVIHEQWIEVLRKDGQTVTTFYPPNRELERLRLEMDPPPTLIYRRFNFVHGVPAEYMWSKPDEQTEINGGLFLQRIRVEDWPELMASERQQTGTHARGAPNHQPRPAAFGPCPCARCEAERSKALDAG